MINVEPIVKGLIFDCDGILAYTMEAHWTAWVDTFNHFGYECPVDFLDSLKGMAGREIVHSYNKHFGTALEPNTVSDHKQGLVFEKLKKTREVVAVCDVVRQYSREMPMAVASGGTLLNVNSILKTIGLLDEFDAILTADDPIPPKPHPAIFLEAASRLGCAPETCLVFEDGAQGFAAALAAGIPSIDVRPYYSRQMNPAQKQAAIKDDMYDAYHQ
jgi:HAD superfamily hydrolase (TIGR01509 family)